MGKYHKGDKFIVEIKEVINSDNGTLYRSDFKTLTFDDNGLDKLQKCETELSWDECYNEGLENGRNEVWELIRKIFTTDCATLQKVFGHSDEGTIIMLNEPQKALEKLEAYEKEQNEIKVGDVIVIDDEQILVTNITKGKPNTTIDGIREDGEVLCYSAKQFTKTGKHIDIQSILQQIGGGNNA